MASGPTARTLEMLHKEGYIAQVVERWNPWAQRKIDLFNCIDIIAVRPTRCSIVGIQCTTGSHHAVRRAKILSEPKARAWLECGGSIEIRSWSRRGGRGKRKNGGTSRITLRCSMGMRTFVRARGGKMDDVWG